MTSSRDRLLAILKEPDRYSISDVQFPRPRDKWEDVISDKNASHRLKRLCEEIAAIAKEEARGPLGIQATVACQNIAATILALGEPNEHS